jgi:hypothetical protein
VKRKPASSRVGRLRRKIKQRSQLMKKYAASMPGNITLCDINTVEQLRDQMDVDFLRTNVKFPRF